MKVPGARVRGPEEGGQWPVAGGQEEGDCETCRFFLAEESTCLWRLMETHSFNSCHEWRKKE